METRSREREARNGIRRCLGFSFRGFEGLRWVYGFRLVFITSTVFCVHMHTFTCYIRYTRVYMKGQTEGAVCIQADRQSQRDDRQRCKCEFDACVLVYSYILFCKQRIPISGVGQGHIFCLAGEVACCVGEWEWAYCASG